MDADTCRKTADNIAAELRDIGANEPDFPPVHRAFMEDCERGFRALANEKGGYSVDDPTLTGEAATGPVQDRGSADFGPENAVVVAP